MFHDPQQLRTVEHFYALLVKKAAGYMFSEINRSTIDMVEIYRWVAGKKVSSAKGS